MEVNARLQVEHPVTEMVTGLDLVKLQLHVAAGGQLEASPRRHRARRRGAPERRGPGAGFAPAPGRIALLRLPTGPGVRVDTGVAEGDVIPAEFDSHDRQADRLGRDRDEAPSRLRRALGETMVVVEAVRPTQASCSRCSIDLRCRRARLTPAGSTACSCAARSCRCATPTWRCCRPRSSSATPRRRPTGRAYAYARRGRPQTGSASPACRAPALSRPVLPARGLADRAGPLPDPGRRRRRRGRDAAGRAPRARPGSRVPLPDHHLGAGFELLVEVDGVPHRVARDDGGMVRSLSPAVVVSIPVAEGDEVQAGDVVAVLESMKMETSLIAPSAAGCGASCRASTSRSSPRLRCSSSRSSTATLSHPVAAAA